MTKILDFRLPSSGRYDAIRWLEYSVLLLIAVVAVFLHQPYGTALVVPIALVALWLIPGKRVAATREQQRLNRLNDLQQVGLSLRAEWGTISERPINEAAALERWRIQREILQWMSGCEQQLHAFPEVGGIFAARRQRPDPVDDLDICLSMLSRLRRLVSLSERLKLPI